MKKLSFYVLGFSLALSPACSGQIDIYESEYYSVEEMCAREAERNTVVDYSEAYESCIKQNEGRARYQTGPTNGDFQRSNESRPDNADQQENSQADSYYE